MLHSQKALKLWVLFNRKKYIFHIFKGFRNNLKIINIMNIIIHDLYYSKDKNFQYQVFTSI
jgi:hypothetical protein